MRSGSPCTPTGKLKKSIQSTFKSFIIYMLIYTHAMQSALTTSEECIHFSICSKIVLPKMFLPAFKYFKVTHQISHSQTISCSFGRICWSYTSLCCTNAAKKEKNYTINISVFHRNLSYGESFIAPGKWRILIITCIFSYFCTKK